MRRSHGRSRARIALPIAAALVALSVASVVATTTTAARADAGYGAVRGTAATGTVSWSPPLAGADASGVIVRDGRVRLDPATAFTAPVEAAGGRGAEGAAGSAMTGLLTLAAQRLGAATGAVKTAVEGQVPPGATATVDVRAQRASGNWSEWLPAGPDGVVRLPEAARLVQARLVLTGEPGPVVSAVTLSALTHGANGTAGAEGSAAAEGGPVSYRVFATREGLVGATTANGHVITANDHFVALPSRRALSPRDSSDYSVRVCAANGRCAFAPVWDVGPWNTKDDYWNPAPDREQWDDLPRGTPQAQAAYRTGYNGGKDGFGRVVANPAGIDLADGVFWDALGLKTNSTVTVDYLWTGDVRLAKVAGLAAGAGADRAPAGGLVDVLGAPTASARVVGAAAAGAGVPVSCRTGTFLRIGPAQYLPATAVPSARSVPACAG